MAPSTSTHTLGTLCLELGRAVIVVGGQPVALPAPVEPTRHAAGLNPYGPVVGIRCAASVSAIAYPIAAHLVHADADIRRVAVVVGRHGKAEVIDPNCTHPLRIDDKFGPVVDVGRRALGLRTPPEPTPPVVMLDAIWIDRALVATLDSDLGSPPPWPTLSSLHPLSGAPIAPWMLRDRRLALAVDWSAFRQRATGVDTAWPNLSPSLADWLDDGSFARWILAELPSTHLLLDDLIEPEAMVDIDEALAGTPQW